MEFGLFSNGFRPTTSAAQTYDEDIHEIVLADQLGFDVAFISEHHGEQVYVDRIDICPIPELLMCKAAALTKRIRMGAAVKLIHLHHPLDVATLAAVTDHMTQGRYIFGFGSGFPTPVFSQERGLDFEERYGRVAEGLEFIRKCWSERQPFDWSGKYYQGKGVVALPKPFNGHDIPMATATDSAPMLKYAAETGTTILSGPFDDPKRVRTKSANYARDARAAGRSGGPENFACARYIYIANSKREAIEDLRAAVAHETGFQEQRGFIRMLKTVFNFDLVPGETAIDQLVECGQYVVGEPDEVAAGLKQFHAASGGFGTMMIVCGKDWATREKRARSMRLFMEKVAPELRDLQPAATAEAAE